MRETQRIQKTAESVGSIGDVDRCELSRETLLGRHPSSKYRKYR